MTRCYIIAGVLLALLASQAESRQLEALKPGAPAHVSVTLHNSQSSTGVLVRVTPPTGSNGTGLNYTVVGYPANKALPRLLASGAGLRIPGTNQRQFLINGHKRNLVYHFTARAVSTVGAGPERVPHVVFYECSKYFNYAGAGCKCGIPSTGCLNKSADQCSCLACVNSYRNDGKGGCTKCAGIANCAAYSSSTCKCTACKRHFAVAGNGTSCQCSLPGTGCLTKKADQCSCQACVNSYRNDDKGGCTKCAGIVNCATYSTTTCKCTACQPYFTAVANGTSCQAQLEVPAMPGWAKNISIETAARDASFNYNKQLVAAANASGTVFDVVHMGDSITRFSIVYPDSAAVWMKHWGPSSGLKSACLGVGGTTVEELTWRLVANGERLKVPPRVVVLLVGINNNMRSEPWKKLDFLLNEWFAAAMPTTKLLVVAPLPSYKTWLNGSESYANHVTLREQYEPVVARCAQCTFSTCGSDFVVNSTLFKDRIHPSPTGYDALYNCFKPVVLSLLASG